MSMLPDGLTSQFKGFLTWIDKGNATRRIILDIGIIFAAFALTSMLVAGHMNPGTWFTHSNGVSIMNGLANPNYARMMALPAIGGLAGLGIGALMQDSIPKKWHRGLAKVLIVVAPILMLGGCVALITSGGMVHGPSGGTHFDLATSVQSNTFVGGILLLPFVFLLADRASKVCSDDRISIPQTLSRRAHRPHRLHRHSHHVLD